MAQSLKDLAIKCALENKWDQAIDFNLQILSENPNDIGTLNRLAFAYMQVSKLKEAEKTYNKVLSLDQTNPIAVKNIKKIQSINGNSGTLPTRSLDIHNSFIEEAGKTRVIELKNLADKKTLSTLQTGENVYLVPKRSKIYIQNFEKKYIGMLPDSIGMRLTDFIQGGNEYTASIRSVSDKNVVVFIKETKRAEKFKNLPSFLPQTTSSKTARSR